MQVWMLAAAVWMLLVAPAVGLLIGQMIRVGQRRTARPPRREHHVHVVPLGDQVEHHVPGGIDDYRHLIEGWLAIEATGQDTGCVCGPRVEHVANDAGADGWLVTHHSCDGREQREPSPTSRS